MNHDDVVHRDRADELADSKLKLEGWYEASDPSTLLGVRASRAWFGFAGPRQPSSFSAVAGGNLQPLHIQSKCLS